MEKMRKIDWVGLAVIVCMFLFFIFVSGPEQKTVSEEKLPWTERFKDCDSVQLTDAWDQEDRVRWRVECFIYTEKEDGTQNTN